MMYRDVRRRGGALSANAHLLSLALLFLILVITCLGDDEFDEEDEFEEGDGGYQERGEDAGNRRPGRRNLSFLDKNRMTKARDISKPWFLRKIQYQGKELPISLTSIVVFVILVFYIAYGWNRNSKPAASCEASHILLMEHTDEARDKLDSWKNMIGSDPSLFSKYAKKYSACPSKQNGGNLGRFRQYDMAPPFDKVCFDPESKLQTTLGPVQTQFGWHLIYIHFRQLPEHSE